jgi:hypothetical protein
MSSATSTTTTDLQSRHDDSDMWFNAEDVKPLVAGLHNYLVTVPDSVNRFHRAVDPLHRVEGTLVEALWNIASALESTKASADKLACGGANALRVLCSFSPPMVGERLENTFQMILLGMCFSCSDPVEIPVTSDQADVADPNCTGAEFFLCGQCSQTQLVPIADAYRELPTIPRNALPDLVVPPGPTGCRYTLRVFIDEAKAIEDAIAAGSLARPADCFPGSLCTMLPPPGENTSDPIYITLRSIADVCVRRQLYSMREHGGPEVRASIDALTEAPKAKAKSRQAGHVTAIKADKLLPARQCKLRSMARRWEAVTDLVKSLEDTYGDTASTVLPIALAMLKCKAILPGPGALSGTATNTKRFIAMLTKDSVPDTVPPESTRETVKQIGIIADIVARASQSTESFQFACVRALMDKDVNGGLVPPETKDRKPKPKKKPPEAVVVAVTPPIDPM